MKDFFDRILGRKTAIRSRIFRVILLAAAALTIGGLIEDILVMDNMMTLFPMLVLAVAVFFALLFNYRFRRETVAVWILGLALITGILPMVYFTSGGIRGGATVWFVLGMVYVFLMFDGAGLWVMLGLSIISVVMTYVIGYLYPAQIQRLTGKGQEMMDSMVSVILIGLVIGIILKFQLFVYEQERRINEKQRKQLQDAGLAKNLFFAKISHEIRTPINTVIGLNEMNLREKMSPEMTENSVNIQTAAVSLLGLVNELLDLSQIETSRMSLYEAEYDVKKFFGNLMDMIAIRARNKHLGIRFDVDPNIPAKLKGDEKRLGQIVMNLLTNAVKYTEQGVVHMEAHLETISEKEIWLIISVADTGYGIRKEDIPYLFEYFHRVDESKTHRIEGSGLGLSITKQLVDLMGGEITVDSIYKKGSTFRVRIPQEVLDAEPVGIVDFTARMKGRPMMHGAPGMPYMPKFEAPDARILIVDDAKMNIEVLRKLLRATKVQIDGALSGDEALSCTAKHFYHLIIMDYMMPGMNGAQLLRNIRQQEDGLCRETPTVCLTGTAKTDTGQEELGFGFDGYLQKPVRGELLEGTVLKFLPKDVVEVEREARNKKAEDEMMAQLAVNRIVNHRKKRICITTNGLCDLNRKQAEAYGVRMIFSYIETAKGRFVDTVEIDGRNLQNVFMDAEKPPLAVSPTVEDYESFFADTLEEAEDVIHISVADKLGTSYENALAAAGSFDHVRVFNSGKLSGGLGILVIQAAGMVRKGMKPAAIMAELETVQAKISGSFLFPSIAYLASNGHVGKMVSLVGKRIKLYPVCDVRKSGIHFVTFKSGGFDVVRRRFVRQVFRFRRKVDPSVAVVTHAGCSIREMDMVVREIRRYVNFEKVIVQRSCVANAINSGQGTIGIAFMKK